MSGRNGAEVLGRLRWRRWVTFAAILAALVSPAGRAWAQPTLREIVAGATDEGSQTQHGSATPAPAQASAAAPASATSPGALDRQTPRGTMTGFLEAAGDGDYGRAARYLDLSHLRPALRPQLGPQLARHLRVILDRTVWINPTDLSDSPEGRTDDGLPASQERVARIAGPNSQTVDILLQRVPHDGTEIWKVAPSTVREIPPLYHSYGYGALGEILPTRLLEYEIGGVGIWQGVALAVLVVLAWIGGWLANLVLRVILRGVWKERGQRAARFLRGPLHLALAASLFSFSTGFLPLALTTKTILGAVETALLTAAFTWVVLRGVDLGFRLWSEHLARRGKAQVLPLLSPGRRTCKILAVAIAILAVLSSFGYDVTAVVAGLGVGGIAVALAAQKSIENLFGGVSIYADQPVRVGEFCRFGTQLGTVEEIGLRSTRIRTLERSLLTIPNAEFAQLQIDNLSRRDRFWYNPTLGLRYETTPDQIRFVLVEVRKLLYAHPRVDPDPARIRFTSFGPYSLDLEVFAYVSVSTYDDYLEVAEDLNLRIMDVVERAGSSFAFPSQTTYLEEGTGLDREASESAVQQVARWRERGELPLPRFSRGTIDRLRNTLDYPPEGSSWKHEKTAGNGGGPR